MEPPKQVDRKSEAPAAISSEPAAKKAIKRVIKDLDSPKDSSEESGGEAESFLAREIGRSEFYFVNLLRSKAKL